MNRRTFMTGIMKAAGATAITFPLMKKEIHRQVVVPPIPTSVPLGSKLLTPDGRVYRLVQWHGKADSTTLMFQEK